MYQITLQMKRETENKSEMIYEKRDPRARTQLIDFFIEQRNKFLKKAETLRPIPTDQTDAIQKN